MWPKFTWLLMVGQAVAQSSDDVSSSSRVDRLERLRLTRHTPRPVAPCGNFTFTCSLNASTILSETEGKEIEPSLVLYLRKTGDCSGDETLSNEEWGGAVYSVVLTSNLTYKRTGSWAANPGMNPGVISMEPDGRDFTYTIYKVRRPAEGEKDWCFTCRFERKIVATLTVQMKVSSEGNETECQKEEGKCHLPNSIEDKGFTYERKLSLNDCANCTCKKTQQFHCDLQECTVLDTNTTITTTTTETTTEMPMFGSPIYLAIVMGAVILVMVVAISYYFCTSVKNASSHSSSESSSDSESRKSSSESSKEVKSAVRKHSSTSVKSANSKSKNSRSRSLMSGKSSGKAMPPKKRRRSKTSMKSGKSTVSEQSGTSKLTEALMKAAERKKSNTGILKKSAERRASQRSQTSRFP